MTVILFLGILVAQGMGIWIWGQQLKTEERLRISEVSMNMGARIGQTIQFFSRLPREYRHIVLDQLRDMGGTRFFVSINSQLIPLASVPETQTIERGQSMAQLAISWVLRQPSVASAPIGVRSEAQLLDAIRATSSLQFSSEELASIEAYSREFDLNLWAESSNRTREEMPEAN